MVSEKMCYNTQLLCQQNIGQGHLHRMKKLTLNVRCMKSKPKIGAEQQRDPAILQKIMLKRGLLEIKSPVFLEDKSPVPSSFIGQQPYIYLVILGYKRGRL